MMLDALLLPSGNDAAYTLAVTTARVYKNDPKLSNEKAVKVFAELMNKAAKEIGCKGSHFVCPDGIHDDNHYTTAEDLARIAAYARTVPIVMNSCKKSHVEWELIANGHENDKKNSKASDDDSEEDTPFDDVEYSNHIEWFNSNKLINPESGQYSKYADGMKTGFTDEAGTCLVSSATMNGHRHTSAVTANMKVYAHTNGCLRRRTHPARLEAASLTLRLPSIRPQLAEQEVRWHGERQVKNGRHPLGQPQHTNPNGRQHVVKH